MNSLSKPVESTAKISKSVLLKKSKIRKVLREILKNKYIYIMLVPVIVYYLIFYYAPMYGLIIAFKNFTPTKGIWGSPWVGLKNFKEFFDSIYFIRTLRNTLSISLLDIVFGFPAPIILALMLNEVRNKLFKSTVQTISYLPNFISMVVIVGMLMTIFTSNGMVNSIIKLLGGSSVSFLSEPGWFQPLYVGSGIWQTVGWNSIIFTASLASIDATQYEAARIDGANRWQQLIHVTLPGISHMIIVLLILRVGNIMSLGYEKVVLMYNPVVYETADVISSYVFRRGLLEFNYSYSAAVGLMNSVVNFIFLIAMNTLSAKYTDTALWKRSRTK